MPAGIHFKLVIINHKLLKSFEKKIVQNTVKNTFYLEMNQKCILFCRSAVDGGGLQRSRASWIGLRETRTRSLADCDRKEREWEKKG